jgi:hypothetical protein
VKRCLSGFGIVAGGFLVNVCIALKHNKIMDKTFGKSQNSIIVPSQLNTNPLPKIWRDLANTHYHIDGNFLIPAADIVSSIQQDCRQNSALPVTK